MISKTFGVLIAVHTYGKMDMIIKVFHIQNGYKWILIFMLPVVLRISIY